MNLSVWKQAHAEGKAEELSDKATRLPSEVPALLLEAINCAPVKREKDIDRMHSGDKRTRGLW